MAQKKIWPRHLTRTERLALLERGAERTLTLAIHADLLSLNRTGLYYSRCHRRRKKSRSSIGLMKSTPCIHSNGSRKIVVVLRPDFIVNRKAVQRHMREMASPALYPARLEPTQRQHKIYPYLLRI